MRQVSAFSLDQTLDLLSLSVAPQTSLPEAICQMGQASIHCYLPSGGDGDQNHQLLAEQYTGCVLVLDHSQLVGILTEQDIVRLIAEHRSLAELNVADVMSQQVMTLKAEDNLDVLSTLDLMRHHQIRHLPVVDEQGQVMGVLTPRQLRSLLEPADLLKLRQVHEAMNSEAMHALPTDSVFHITQIMSQHRVSCVVIVKPKNRPNHVLSPIGIITERDIVQCQRLELNLEQIPGEDVMSTPLFLINPADSLWTVYQTMQHHKVQRLVVADDQGNLQGMITQSHLLPVDPVEMYEMLNLSQRRNQNLEQLVQERTSKLQRREEILHNLALGVAAETGENFLRSLVNALTKALKVDYAFIGVVHKQSNCIRTLAGYGEGNEIENFEYDLANTPCEQVIANEVCLYPSNVQQLFPQDPFLCNYQVEGYLGTPLINAAGQVIGLLSILSRHPMSDPKLMTEVLQVFAARAAAELERQTLETERQRFFELSLDILCIAGLDGYFKQVNPSFERILGYSNGELLTQPFLSFIHPEDREITATEAESLASGRQTLTFENRYRCSDGSYKWLLWSAIPDLEKQLIYAVGREITERKQNEESLRLKVKQQATVAQLGHVALTRTDLQSFMDEMVGAIAHTLEIEYCKILELLPNEKLLFLKAGVGWHKGLVGQATVDTEQNSQAGYTLNSSEPIIVDDLSSETRFSGPSLLVDHQVVSGMSVIIPGQEKPFGILGAHTTQHRTFSKDDINFLTSMANGIAYAIERHKTEAILKQSEARFRALVNSAPVGIFQTGPQGKWLFVNSRWQSMTGLTADDAMGTGWFQALHHDDRERVWAEWSQATQSHQEFSSEYRFQTPDGQVVWASGKAISLHDEMSEITGYLGTVTDISDLKQAEAAQQDSQQRLSSILDSLQDIVWSVAADSYEMLYLSPAAERIYGQPIADFLEDPELWLQMIHPDDRSRVRAFTDSLLETGSNQMEYRIIRPDGSIRWLLDRALVIYDSCGIAIRLDGVATDITDRILTQQKVQEQAALLDVATDAILVRGIDNRILFWNKGAETLYGWTSEEAIGQNANQLLYCDAMDQEAEIQLSLIRKERWEGECQQVTKGGQEITVMSRWTFVKDQPGNPKFVLTVNTDITQQKQLETQFLRAQRLESIGTLTSGIAHDLNNILTPIYGVAQLLPMQLPDANEHIQHQFAILQDSAKRGAKIISQMLSFSRGVEGERTALQIKHLISEILSFIHNTFPKSIEISTDIVQDLWSVRGDTTQLDQVFMNLFINARDAMPKGGSLSVSAMNLMLDQTFAASHIEAQIGPYVLATIADSGIGISEDQLEHIFEPFFTTKQPEGGTGLGLSTVHSIIHRHGGFITAYSELGKGTQFKIYLPAIEAAEAVEPEVLDLPSGNGELVLLVDDEAPIREVAQSVLENHNYRVLVALDGIDAIAQYTQHQTDIKVVLMDMTMPSLGGATAIQVMEKINPQLKAIVVSGLPGNEQIASAIGESVKGFLQKPYSSASLLRTLHNILDVESENRGESTPQE